MFIFIDVEFVELLSSAHIPSAFIHVSTPASLHFSVDPGRVWVLERGRSYEITVDLLDTEAHRMLVTKVSVSR